MKKLFILVAALGMFGCTESDDTKGVVFEQFEVKSPFENVAVKFEEYNLLNENGGKISLINGSYIEVPKGAFSNDSGQVLKGDITIKFRDFKNPAEIIASGIPMTYDSARTANDFQSAGMYEIRAYQNGQEVTVTPGKQIEVGLSSARSDADFNFYDLKEDGNWDYNFTCNPSENPTVANKIEEAKKNLVSKEPIKPVVATDDTPVFDFKYNKETFPELAAFGNVLWTPFKNQGDFSKLVASGANSVEIEKNDRYSGVYNLVVATSEGEQKLYAQPVFIGDDYADAMSQFDSNMKAYEKEWATKQDEINRLISDQKFMRTSMISGMGIYNYDRIFKRDDIMFVKAGFKVNETPDFKVKKVYLVSNNTDVIYYNEGRFDKFGYIPSDNNTVVAVLPNDKIGYYKINPAVVGKDKDFEFELTVADDVLSSPEEINNFIQNL